MNDIRPTTGENILHELVDMLTEAETAVVIVALRQIVNSHNPEERIKRLAELQATVASDLGVLTENEGGAL